MASLGEEEAVANPVRIDGRTMIILYGSETGNGEEIAGELGKMAQRLHFQATVDEMDNFKLSDLLRASLVIFVTSTTGQGDMPKNTRKFWRNLRREKLNNTNCLAALQFSIFGLGDSSYPKFNWAARKLRVRLLQLGASEFHPPGEADERHDNGIDSVYLSWFGEIRTAILTSHPLPESIMPIPDDVQLPPKYGFTLHPTSSSSSATNDSQEQEQRFLATRTESAVLTHIDHPRSKLEQAIEDHARLKGNFPAVSARSGEQWERQSRVQVDGFDKDNIIKDHPQKYLLLQDDHVPGPIPSDRLPIPNTFVARVASNERVTPEGHWQDVRHIVLGVSLGDKTPFTAAAGATVVIYPKNYPEDVQSLIDLMGWGPIADTPINFKLQETNDGLVHCPNTRPSKLFVPDGATLRFLLTHNLDITSVPKRSFIRELMNFTTEEMEKERLKELVNVGNEQEFYDYTSRPRRTILELLRDFPGVKIPYHWVIDLFPLIRGREFSVCNGGESLTSEPGYDLTLEILVALVEYKTIIRKPRQGLCSRYLKHLPVGTEIRVRINGASSPALHPDNSDDRPVIAIATGTGIAPIRALIEDRKIIHRPNRFLLFFGCRNKDADFYFRDEWETSPEIQVIPAFSRDPLSQEQALGLLDWRNNNTQGTTTTTTDSSAAAQITPPPQPSFETTGLLVHDYDAGKNYVQNQIRKHAALVGELMREYPLICVCGNSGRMPLSVRAALRDVLVMTGIVKTSEEGDAWLADGYNCTYWQETW
ncbi:hypothetical protein QBC47DRAFT_201688 [Echria macrotheca]|uniref:NADPH-dependent diflavin oxidoreductase 1 n=1 Tax=Echria macrotheca TaxID=438768 RepID=A0AAJ0BHL1_9PEZI|nr:hypothetical protein QBC47DRAFT_201688 [Echria macrotheca]